MNPAEFVALVEEDLDRAFLLDTVRSQRNSKLIGHGTFMTGDTSRPQITIPAPADHDFYATRMNLYLSSRLVDQSAQFSDATERTFRPADWTNCGYNVYPNANLTTVSGDAACEWSLTDSWNGPYNNSPVSIASVYSTRHGVGVGRQFIPWSAWPSGLFFVVPYLVPRGHSVTVRITPTFSRIVNALIKAQYRVTAVMWGTKELEE